MLESANAAQKSACLTNAEEKETNLRRWMREMKSVLVAYSGGVDSAYLAFIANEELADRALCVTGISPSVSARQRTEATDIATTFGFNFSTIDTNEFEDPNYISNPTNRCYFCKAELFTKLDEMASTRGIAVVVDGTNADDLGGHRPGRVAATERGVRSPLAELGFTKDDIRELSRVKDLPTWDRPASPCLSSRVAYGVPVTLDRLSRVERGEEFLREQGLREFRVREHGELARIEIAPDEMHEILNRETVERFSAAFMGFGFTYVTLDLTGFRSGSLNETGSLKK